MRTNNSTSRHLAHGTNRRSRKPKSNASVPIHFTPFDPFAPPSAEYSSVSDPKLNGATPFVHREDSPARASVRSVGEDAPYGGRYSSLRGRLAFQHGRANKRSLFGPSIRRLVVGWPSPRNLNYLQNARTTGGRLRLACTHACMNASPPERQPQASKYSSPLSQPHRYERKTSLCAKLQKKIRPPPQLQALRERTYREKLKLSMSAEENPCDFMIRLRKSRAAFQPHSPVFLGFARLPIASRFGVSENEGCHSNGYENSGTGGW